MAHAQQLEIGELAVAGHHLRQHVRAGASPTLLDGVGEVLKQRLRLVQIGLAEDGLVRVKRVLPVDQTVAILKRKTIKVQEDLKRVQIGEIRYRVALAAAG